jgi:hypothetical protein
MKFADLLRTPASGLIGDQQRQSGQRFWQGLDRTDIGRWKPGVPIPTSGFWLLIGLAPSWSTYDLELVDSIVEKVTDPKRPVQVGFFDVSDLHNQADIDLYIPGLKKFYQTPVVGLWKDGQLMESENGERARRIGCANSCKTLSLSESDRAILYCT